MSKKTVGILILFLGASFMCINVLFFKPSEFYNEMK